MHEIYLDRIKNFEGFTPQARWDYAQNSVGFGTKALFPGERITKEEADTRFRNEIAEARAIVDRHAGNWDEGTKAALTSLTFNAGTRWIGSGLGDAVRAGDVHKVKECFLAYTRAGGDVLPGLVKRRLAEASWIGEPAAAPCTTLSAAQETRTPAAPRTANSDTSSEADRWKGIAVPILEHSPPAATVSPVAHAIESPYDRIQALSGERHLPLPADMTSELGSSPDAFRPISAQLLSALSLKALTDTFLDRSISRSGTKSEEPRLRL